MKEPTARSRKERKSATKPATADPTDEVNPKPTTSGPKVKNKKKAEQCRKYREQKHCEEYRETERQRVKLYRDSMDEDQRRRYNEGSKERMRRSRAKKKAAEKPSASAEKKVKKPATRSHATKAAEMREYKRLKMREYRAKMSGNKKRGIRQKDTNYRRKKDADEKDANAAEQQRKKQMKDLPPKSSATKLPQSPRAYAQSVEKLIDRATPKKRAELERRQIYKTRTRQSLSEAFKRLSQAAKKTVLNILRKHRVKDKKGVAKAIGISRGAISRKPKGYATRRKVTPVISLNITQFYTRLDVSTLMPNKRKSVDDHPFYIMQSSLLSAYKTFCHENPSIKIGFGTFYKNKPKYVHLLKKFKWLQCVCDVCANVKYLLLAASSSMTRCGFELPEWLMTSDPIKAGLLTLCSGSEKRQGSCLARKCADCGVGSVVEDLKQWAKDNVADVLRWKEWRHVVEIVKNKEVKRMKLVLCSGSRAKVVGELRGRLDTFGSHSFFARWQQRRFRENCESFDDDAAVAVLDFSENFTCTQQEEAQSAYYSHTQITLHPTVCFYKENGKVIRDTVAFVSNDLKHDAGAVFCFVNQTIEHLKDKVPTLRKVHLWSDGCAAQYKSKQPFTNLAGKYGHTDMNFEWNFFGSRHGKNPSDGESGVIKSKMSRLMISSQIHIDSAADFAKECASHLTVLDGESRRHVYHVPSAFITTFRDKQVASKMIKGTRSIHCLQTTTYGMLKHRSASCFCVHCRDQGDCLFGVDKFVSVTMFRGSCNVASLNLMLLHTILLNVSLTVLFYVVLRCITLYYVVLRCIYLNQPPIQSTHPSHS